MYVYAHEYIYIYTYICIYSGWGDALEKEMKYIWRYLVIEAAEPCIGIVYYTQKML